MRRKKLCKGCREYWRPKDDDPEQIAHCSPDCAIAIVKKKWDRDAKNRLKSKERALRKQKQQHRKQKREFYENDKKTRREAAVYWFNRYIRLRDTGNGCASCGNNRPGIKFDCGHFITAGSCSALRFNEDNAHSQCVHCNRHLSGNVRLYRAALVTKLGEQAVLFLEGPQPIIKITVEWYKQIEDKYKAKCKELENEPD